jgi:uncharacterized delta-60 repeat protein
MRSTLSGFLFCSTLFAYGQIPGIDYSFQAVPPEGVVNKILVLPDGKIMVGGSFFDYAGTQRQGLVRLHPDGTLDTDWNSGVYGLNGTVYDMEVMPDGRIVIGGNIISYNGISCGNLARLHPDGTLDGTFTVPYGAINGIVLQLELHLDDKVVAAGEFQHCYGISQPHIARFNYNGSLDGSFDIGEGFYATVRGLKVLPDWRIMAVGDFNMFDQNTCMYMARLNSDGTYDSSFAADPGLHGTLCHGRAVDAQPDGKILIAGAFTHHAGQPANDLIRLHTDGSRDQSFVSPFSPWANVNAVEVLPDGKILVGGEFTSGFYWPAVAAPARFVRLELDGSWDSSLPLATGFTEGTENVAFIKDMSTDAEGRILVGGMFGACDGETQYRNIIRLQPEMTVGLPHAPAEQEMNISYDDRTGEVLIRFVDPLSGSADVALYSTSGQLTCSERTTSASNGWIRLQTPVQAGLYLVRVSHGAQVMVGRVVIP